MIDVTTVGSREWAATRDGEPAGSLHALVRPDTRCCVYARVPPADLDVLIALHRAALSALGGEVFTEIDEPLADVDGASPALVALGYQITRREHQYAIPTDAIHVDRAPLPAGFTVVSAADADLDRVRELDELARGFAPLTNRKFDHVVCEVDVTNTASNAVMARLGARRVGGGLELVHRR